MFAPELNLALLENRTHRGHGGASEEQQVLTYRYGEQAAERSVAKRSSSRPRHRPPLVDDVVVSILAADQVRVIWRPPDVAEGRPAISGYQVERAVVDVYSEDQLVQLKSRTRPLEEPSVGAIARIGMFETVTPESFAESTYTDREVDLNMPQRVHGEPLYQRRFSDDSLDDGGKPYRFGVYAYRVRAVDAQGNVSGPSPAVLTIPSAPQWVFSREDDTVCQLKWAANPEQGVAGYRVYRLDGRWNSDAVPRLTDEPLEATVYTDAIAGEATRRYHIVAVDALGQEGFPSSPVWYRREWERFYRPFVGEWHQ
jgi:hypothetical protein